MGIKKTYSKGKPDVKVTFSVAGENVPEKSKVFLVGDFNNWEEQSLRLKKTKTGDYSISLTLPVGSTFEFKYNIDNAYWINDNAADAYIPNPFGGDNSLVEL